MKKLLIVPAILAMSCMSGSAFAQRTATAVQNTGSGVTALGSPTVSGTVPSCWSQWQHQCAGLRP